MSPYLMQVCAGTRLIKFDNSTVCNAVEQSRNGGMLQVSQSVNFTFRPLCSQQ